MALVLEPIVAVPNCIATCQVAAQATLGCVLRPFFRYTINYLNCVATGLQETSATVRIPPPTSIKKVQMLLGMCNHNDKLVCDFAIIPPHVHPQTPFNAPFTPLPKVNLCPKRNGTSGASYSAQATSALAPHSLPPNLPPLRKTLSRSPTSTSSSQLPGSGAAHVPVPHRRPPPAWMWNPSLWFTMNIWVKFWGSY